ncbi:MAG TPA: hypothetical protein PLU95_09700 [Syntrophales bacterium]|jgi:hypothetical protein|nr:hypothetical protein [Syntrophales bacterium]
MTIGWLLKPGRRDRLGLVGFRGIAFRGSEAILLMAPGHLFVGLFLALYFPLPLGEFFLTFSGHASPFHESVQKNPEAFLLALGNVAKTETKKV